MAPSLQLNRGNVTRKAGPNSWPVLAAGGVEYAQQANPANLRQTQSLCRRRDVVLCCPRVRARYNRLLCQPIDVQSRPDRRVDLLQAKCGTISADGQQIAQTLGS